MQVDQTKLLDSLAYKNTQETGKGIGNYITDRVCGEGKTCITGQANKKDETTIASAETVNMMNTTYFRPETEQEKTVADNLVCEETTAESRYNEMAVLTNTTSEEDLKEMQKDGFPLNDTDSRTIVTVVDKIKVALAKAGVDITAYGDSLSKAQLEELVGSSAVAEQMVAQLSAQDLPTTAENIQDMGAALEKANQLVPFSDDAMKYLMKNNLAPTIENVYCAEYSYSESQTTIETISDADFAQMRNQVEQIIKNAGYEVKEEILDDCHWIINQGMPLTEENLSYLEDLKGLSDYIGLWDEKSIANAVLPAMADAISEGNRPMNAMMMDGYSLKDQAKQSMQVIADVKEEDLAYLIADDKELTIENLQNAAANRKKETPIGQAAKKIVSEQGLALLTAKRQLEEVRLAMTSEANYALLKKGIAIDTKPLVDLVEELKGQEDRYYKELLGQEGIDTEENVAIFKETHQVMEDLKTAPAYVLKPGETDTLHTLHAAGTVLKDTFARAEESYEALMTAPRKDMGDSISKAFRNVDDILEDLNIEATDTNRRAVRILAYNQMELTTENIAAVKAKDEDVQRAFANLTPKVTLEMIKHNINPLDMEISQLNRVAQEIKSELGNEDAERFNKYLWKLEQNQSITEEERSSYIGIYRLIAQVEKADGAAIGSLMQQGADITMRTLLTAVRTNRRGSMDYQVDDQFDGVDSIVKNPRIDEQIEMAYQQNCMHDAMDKITPEAAKYLSESDWEKMTPEQIKEAVEKAAYQEADAIEEQEQAYIRKQMSEFSGVLSTSEEVYAYLERANIPNTVNNILAVQQMLQNRNRMFETLWKAKGATASSMERIEEMKDLVLERFGEAVKSPEEMADAQEALADLAEHIMDTMIIEQDDVSTVNIRELRMMSQQLTLMAKQAKEESYMIPIQTGEGVTGVSLKIVRGTEKKGMVDILFHGNIMGKVAASFEAKENGISGMIATDNEETRQLLADHLNMLVETMNENGGEQIDLRVAKVADLSLERYESATNSRQSDGVRKGAIKNTATNPLEESETVQSNATRNSEYEVQTSRLYHIAESFIKTVQEFL